MTKQDLEKEYLAYLLNNFGVDEPPFNTANNNQYTRFLESKLIGAPLTKQIKPQGLRILVNPKNAS